MREKGFYIRVMAIDTEPLRYWLTGPTLDLALTSRHVSVHNGVTSIALVFGGTISSSVKTNTPPALPDIEQRCESHLHEPRHNITQPAEQGREKIAVNVGIMCVSMRLDVFF